jgi:glycosyltransferase involved in cell wall biosynthesis
MNKFNFIYHSIKNGGGMERYALDVIKEFARRNIKVRVVTRQVSEEILTTFPSIQFIIIPDTGFLGRFENVRFELLAKKYIEKNAPVISISRIYGGADIIIKGGTHRGHLINKRSRIKSLYDQVTIWLENKAFKNAKIIVAHSLNTKKEICSLYNINEQKIKVLYPPIDGLRFSTKLREKRASYRTELNLADEDFMVLFPSNDHKRKGASLITSAIHKLQNPNLKLFIAGKKALNGSNVFNLGYRSDIEKLYVAADAVILASTYEPFGLVGPESVLCGTKSILMSGIGCTEVLTAESCIMFENDVDSLANALTYAIKTRDQLIPSHEIIELKLKLNISSHIDELLTLLG